MSRRKGDGLPYTVGSKPNTVRLYRRPGRTALYLRTWDASARDGRGGWRKRSLGHSDVERGKTQAAKLHARLVAGEKRRQEGVPPTLARLLALYRRHRSPHKSESMHTKDKRRARLWCRVLGGRKDPRTITRREWEGFIEARGTGAIDAVGLPVSEGQRQPVRARTVSADLIFLESVMHWCVGWQDSRGRYVLESSPVRGFDRPREKNPKRPVATDARVRAIRAVAGRVMMNVTWGENREAVPSHLAAIFDLAVETGRRLSAILGLTYSDLLLDRFQHGAIRWRADLDKTGRESVVPINAAARQAIDAHSRRQRQLGLPGIGEAPLFPAPNDPSEPVDRSRADRWLRKAEGLAKLDPQEGSLWHAYRRRWATVRKHLPAKDVATAGGWAGPETLQEVYQQADADTMYEVVTSGGELREVAQ